MHLVIHEECLSHGTGIGHAGGLNQDVVELVAALHEITQDADEVSANGAADAAVIHLEDLFFGANHQFLIHADFAELVFDHRNAFAVLFAKDAVEQGSLAGSQEASQDRDRYTCIGGQIESRLVCVVRGGFVLHLYSFPFMDSERDCRQARATSSFVTSASGR